MSSTTYKAAGAMATLWFFGALLVFGSQYPGYSHFTNAISELGAFGAPHALAWDILGFIIPGLLVAVCGAGVALAIDGIRTKLYWFLIVPGFAFAAVGLFPAVMHNGTPVIDSAWTTGHIVMLLVSGVAWVIGSVVLVRHVGRSARRHSRKSVGILLSVMAFVGVAINVFASAIPMLDSNPGLAQRVAFAVFFAWYVLAAFIFVAPSSLSRYASA